MGKIYLCKPDRKILGTLTGLIADSCSLTMHTADIWELSFDVDKYITDENGNYMQSDYYASIAPHMEIYLETEKTSAFFKITSAPVRKNDGIQEVLSVTARSIECELQNKILKNFKVNCGTIDSLEYLAAGIDDYKQEIKKYVTLVNYENHSLSLLHMAIEKSGATWSIADNLDHNLCSSKASQFDIQSQDIYSFLMNDVSNAARIIFDFDRKNKVISFKPVEQLGEDTGITIGMKNLMKDFEISSTSNENIITKYIPKGANDLGIEYVNFGEDYILNLDYFMNMTNEYGDYTYVSSALHDKYKNWINFRDHEKITYEGISGERTRREWYSYFTRQYNTALMSKNELKNRVPNDGCSIDYTTYTYKELEISLKAYKNAVVSLLEVYRKEYNIPDGTPTDENALKKTVYWNDYYAYQYKIIPSVQEAMKLYCATDANGNLTVDGNGNYIELIGGNPAYNKGNKIVRSIDGWLYEWELYGLDELEAKRKAWIEAAVLLRKDAFFRSDGTLRTPDEAGWNELSAVQKQSFTGYPAYVTALNSYLDYYALKARPNALTGTTTQGIILLCEGAIQERKNEIEKQDDALQQIDEKRKDLAASADLKGYSDSEGNKVFNAEDLRVIELLIKEADFQNNHILITNLNDIATTVDIQEELYQDAVKQLAIISQPQYSFSCNINNLFHLDEFKAFADNFKLNNYIYVNTDIYKEILQKVRLITIKYNPLVVTENIDIEFSTMTKSLDGISDFAYLLNESSGYSGSSSSSGGSGGGGTYGTNDADIQIANTMLNALLSTETFGTSISNIILDSISANKGEFRRLFANSGVFYGLETGELKVSGNCLADKIQSFNYKENGAGSKLNLQDGTFEFAGGKLRWDGKKLIVGGYANASDVSDLSASHKTLSDNYNDYTKGLSNGTTKINGGCLSTGNIISYNYSIPVGGNVLDNTSGSILCLGDGKFNFGGGKLKWDGTNLTINGAGTFSGDITASSLIASQGGTIAGWAFDENGFYKNNHNIAAKNGMYLGNDGISVNDFFVVKKEGMYLKSKDWTSATYSSSIGQTTTGKLFTLSSGQYIKFYLYNMSDIDYFELSWNYDYNYIDNNNNNANKYNEYHIRGWGIGRTENADAYYFDGDNIVVFTLPFDFICKDIEDTVNEVGILLHQIKSITFNRFYSLGRIMNNKFFNSIQIGKIEVYDSDNRLINILHGSRTNTPTGMMINTFTKHIYSSEFSINNKELKHMAVYNSTCSNSPNVYIDENGCFMRSSSSSSRYKKDISPDIPDDISPKKLYDFSIVSYKYDNNYLFRNDVRYKKNIIGFLAEDIYKKYPIACNLDKNGKPEMWNINILFPAALKLIQDQHKEIEQLKKRVDKLEQEN